MRKTKSGFTIVELLIVIVVIAILAAITIVAYNGIQTRALNSKRLSDVSTLQKAVELYKADNGSYPPNATTAANGSCTSNTNTRKSWATDGTWMSELSPNYISTVPNTDISTCSSSYYTYIYLSPNVVTSTYGCPTAYQVYVLTVYDPNLGTPPSNANTSNNPLGACTAWPSTTFKSTTYRWVFIGTST